MEHETVTFECELNKESPATWFMKGKEIKASDTFKMTQDGRKHLLTITDTLLDMTSEISIKADKDTSKAKLTVDGTCSMCYQDGFV